MAAQIILQEPNMEQYYKTYDFALWNTWRAWQYNTTFRIAAAEGEYDCPSCHNRENFMGIHGDGQLCVVDCDCRAIRKNWAAIRASGMEKLMQKCSFENFRASQSWQRELLEGTKAYAQQGKGWLVLCGQSGCGKTHLASAVCRSLAARQKRVQFFSWVEQAPALKAMATDFSARDARLQKYKQAQVLFVDDLFKCGNAALGMRPTEADIRLAHELLEYRNIHDLPTVITTELLPARLGELDEALLGRLLERSGKHLYAVERSPERDLRLQESA